MKPLFNVRLIHYNYIISHNDERTLATNVVYFHHMPHIPMLWKETNGVF